MQINFVCFTGISLLVCGSVAKYLASCGKILEDDQILILYNKYEQSINFNFPNEAIQIFFDQRIVLSTTLKDFDAT